MWLQKLLYSVSCLDIRHVLRKTAVNWGYIQDLHETLNDKITFAKLHFMFYVIEQSKLYFMSNIFIGCA